jgi:hypothetical protein
MIESYWRTEGDQIVYDATVPPNSSADLTLPVTSRQVQGPGVKLESGEGDTTRCDLQAGHYRFSFPVQAIR